MPSKKETRGRHVFFFLFFFERKESDACCCTSPSRLHLPQLCARATVCALGSGSVKKALVWELYFISRGNYYCTVLGPAAELHRARVANAQGGNGSSRAFQSIYAERCFFVLSLFRPSAEARLQLVAKAGDRMAIVNRCAQAMANSPALSRALRPNCWLAPQLLSPPPYDGLLSPVP